MIKLIFLIAAVVLDRVLGLPILLITALFILTRHQTVLQSLFWVTIAAVLAALLYSISPTALIICGLGMVVGMGKLLEKSWPVSLILFTMSGLGVVIFKALGVNWFLSGALVFTSILQLLLASLMIFVTTPLLRRRVRWILTGTKRT